MRCSKRWFPKLRYVCEHCPTTWTFGVTLQRQVREQRRQEAAARRALKVLSPTVTSTTPEAFDANPHSEPTPSVHIDSSKPLDDDVNVDEYLGRILSGQPTEDKLTKMWKQAMVLSGQCASRKVAKKARESCLAQQATAIASNTENSTPQDKLNSRIAELQELLARNHPVTPPDEVNATPNQLPKKTRHKKKAANGTNLADQNANRAALCRITATLLQNLDSLTPAQATRFAERVDASSSLTSHE